MLHQAHLTWDKEKIKQFNYLCQNCLMKKLNNQSLKMKILIRHKLIIINNKLNLQLFIKIKYLNIKTKMTKSSNNKVPQKVVRISNKAKKMMLRRVSI